MITKRLMGQGGGRGEERTKIERKESGIKREEEGKTLFVYVSHDLVNK